MMNDVVFIFADCCNRSSGNKRVYGSRNRHLRGLWESREEEWNYRGTVPGKVAQIIP